MVFSAFTVVFADAVPVLEEFFAFLLFLEEADFLASVFAEDFPDFADFNKEMKDEHIHLVPIIDAGVKQEEGYPVYEEGLKKGREKGREEGRASGRPARPRPA